MDGTIYLNCVLVKAAQQKGTCATLSGLLETDDDVEAIVLFGPGG